MLKKGLALSYIGLIFDPIPLWTKNFHPTPICLVQHRHNPQPSLLSMAPNSSHVCNVDLDFTTWLKKDIKQTAKLETNEQTNRKAELA
jgi:hypothetical protein